MKANSSTSARTASSITQKTLLQKIGKLGTSWSPSFSPDGQSLAYISDVSGSPQVWIIDLRTGERRRITDSNDPIGSVEWSPDGTRLLLAIAPGGNGGNVQIFVLSPDGTGLSRLSEGGDEANWAGPWAGNATFLPVTSNRSDPKSMDTYTIDLATRKYTLVAKNNGMAHFLDVTDDGQQGLLCHIHSISASDIYLVRFATQEQLLITPEGKGSANRNARFSKDGKSVFLTSNHNREFTSFCRISIAHGNKPRSLETIAENSCGDIEDFALSPDGKMAVLLWNVGGATEVEFLQTDSLAREKGPNLPAEIASSPVFSPDGKQLAFTLSGAALPKNIFLLNLDTGTISQVTHSNDQGLDLNDLIRPKPVAFSSHDGLPLSGWLYLPKNFSLPGAVIVSFHGGPEQQERPCFRSDYQALLACGFAIFAPNVRGSSGFGKSFAALDNGSLRFNAIKDIEACVDYVVGHGIAEPTRIATLGASYGGYMVMAGLTSFPKLFRAGASLYGVVNFDTYFKNVHPSMVEMARSEFGDPVMQSQLLRDLSPINRIDDVNCPTILFHGQNDPIVPLSESEQIYQSLKCNGIETKLVVFPDEGHGFLMERNRIRCVLETVSWFKKFL